MNDHELNRERRKQRAFERLGTNNPRCAFCGFDEPAGDGASSHRRPRFDDEIGPSLPQLPSPLERWQKDHPPRQRKSAKRSGTHWAFPSRLGRPVRTVGQAPSRIRDEALRRSTSGREQSGGAAMSDDHILESSKVPDEPDRLPIAVRAFAPPPHEADRESDTASQALRQARAAVRMDARLRHRDYGRRGATAEDWRLSTAQRRRAGRSRALL